MFRKGSPVALFALFGFAVSLQYDAPHVATPVKSADPMRFVLASSGNEARYRVREQLAGFDLPNDAIGKTNDMTGSLTLASDGSVVASESKFVIDVTKLKSDRDRRDGYVQRRLLETDKFPNVELAPTAIRGLSLPLPTSGTKTFDMMGNLTVHGVTKPTTWRVTAKFDGENINGTAITGFTFEDFGLTQPKVPVVLSVADSIHLEYDFNLVPKS